MFSSKFKELRKSIIPPSDLIVCRKVVLLEEEISNRTNCYAYSLGLAGLPCNPGFTCGKPFLGRKTLVSNICKDLKNLNLKYRILKIGYPVLLKKDEYLIKVFYSEKPNKLSQYGDFHFLRKDPATKKWFHKVGFNQPEFIEGVEAARIIISDLTSGDQTYYFPICYFAIKSNKKS